MTGSSNSTRLDNATLALFQDDNTSVAISVIYMVILAVNLGGNGLSMWLLLFRTTPKSTSIIFMINLTFTDLALGTALPFQIAYQLRGYHWHLGPRMCSFLTLVFYTNMYCSILTMMAISIDRYLGIVRPMLFRRNRESKSIALISCFLMWGVVLIVLHPLMTTDLTFDIPELGITTCFDVLKKDMLPTTVVVLSTPSWRLAKQNQANVEQTTRVSRSSLTDTMVLNPVISKLAGKLVVLASASPRRLEILRNAGLRFEVVPSWFKETIDKGLFRAPHEYAVETAKQKALEVARRMPVKHLKTPDIVIGADTIVAVDGMILEKPVDKCDAYRMLSSLSGKEHSVFTGVAIVLCHEKENEEVDYQLIDFYEETKVKFADLSEDMLWEYINSGEPMDKAGGYGIQALGGMLVEYVHGDFLNVVGFPLNHFCKQLDLIYNHWTSPSEQENVSLHLSHNGSHCPSDVTQPSPILSTQCNQSPSSSAKSNSSLSPRVSSPSASQKHNSQDGPASSPVHKGKRKDTESELGESSWTLVNSLSTHPKDGPESTTVQQMPSRGHVSVTEHEDSQPITEDLQRIVEVMDGFKASKALFTASDLGVFDLLQSRPGSDASQVAQEIKASVRGTECLLEACVSLGLLKSKERTCQRPVYENSDLAARFLRSSAPLSLHGYIQHCNKTVWPLFSHLESAVREGTHQHEKAFGKKSKDVFQDAYCNSQEVKLRFMRAMHSVAEVTGAAVAEAFDLSGYKTACDLGGCTGAMAYKFTKAHPGLSVTVFDLPAILEMSEHFQPLHTDNRVSFVAGDFFKDELPKADLYILARILHDWSDEKVHFLLRKIADACTPGCGLLLSEIFLDEDRRGPSRGLLQALSMSEGKQRSATEYGLLLKNYGFITTHVTTTKESFCGCAVLIAETVLDTQRPYSALQSLNMLAQTEGMERTEGQYADILSKHGFGNINVVRTMNFLDAFMAVKM
ncbi:hypothetical protein Q5P01_013798 [Channa striata]|uniref:G-protein coupled receptors family 1 profile domain-containing protein n=1 Tax=Channa striata TaxID=64152 RepID=A0AA88SJI6_CHASR|nr:hypothetical protein Q5P01_013798 [Channa striata]